MMLPLLSMIVAAGVIHIGVDTLATSGICIGKLEECHVEAPHSSSPVLRLLFALGSSELSPQAVTDLGNLALSLAPRQPSFRGLIIEGYADALGSDVENMNLSSRRAAAVKRFLADLGVDHAKMIALGRGEIDQDAGSGNPANRRVDIRLMEP